MSDANALPVCTADPWTDIGHGVSIEKRYLDGRLCGVAYKHPRPGGAGTCDGFVSVPDAEGWPPHSWTLVSIDPLTLTPSLACRACGHHGHITAGRWVPAPPVPLANVP